MLVEDDCKDEDFCSQISKNKLHEFCKTELITKCPIRCNKKPCCGKYFKVNFNNRPGRMKMPIRHKTINTYILLFKFNIFKPDLPLNKCCKTVSGADVDNTCIFPFETTDGTYYDCNVDDDGAWCSTKVDKKNIHISGEGNWGICGPHCPFAGMYVLR